MVVFGPSLYFGNLPIWSPRPMTSKSLLSLTSHSREDPWRAWCASIRSCHHKTVTHWLVLTRFLSQPRHALEHRRPSCVTKAAQRSRGSYRHRASLRNVNTATRSNTLCCSTIDSTSPCRRLSKRTLRTRVRKANRPRSPARAGARTRHSGMGGSGPNHQTKFSPPTGRCPTVTLVALL
jgi:hypothetical protein